MKEKDLEHLKESIAMPTEMADALVKNCTQFGKMNCCYSRYARLCAILMPVVLLIAIGSTSLAAYRIYQDKYLLVFMEYDLTEAEVEAIGEEILKNSDVASCRFVSGGEAWEEFKDQFFKNDKEPVERFTENPLADSFHYEVRVKLGGDEKEVRRQLRKLSGIRLVSVKRDIDMLEDFE